MSMCKSSLLLVAGLMLSISTYADDDYYEPIPMVYYQLPLSGNVSPLFKNQRLGFAVDSRHVAFNRQTDDSTNPNPLDVSYTGDGSLELSVNDRKTLSYPIKVMQNEEDDKSETMGEHDKTIIGVILVVTLGLMASRSSKEECDVWFCWN